MYACSYEWLAACMGTTSYACSHSHTHGHLIHARLVCEVVVVVIRLRVIVARGGHWTLDSSGGDVGQELTPLIATRAVLSVAGPTAGDAGR